MSQTPSSSQETALVKEPEITPELVEQHGLSADEFKLICNYLGRTPTYTELGVYSVMWSEHCSYKNSILEIKKLPRTGPQLLVGAGEENAGLVDIGDGLACAFKIESHNHPSAVEPYQGAATGVGGIHRDIFTMGARPVASLNSLRFGSPENPRVKYLLDGVVRGIGDYGNSFGVPVIGGEVCFDPAYEGNPLVNAMSIGIVNVGETASAISKGVGNPVIIVGSSTGRDGIHGATFASEEISEESEAKRPSVQVGDPFTEKLLLEASLEALKTGAVIGMQDMGAAGIACSTSEMSAKGKAGMKLDLDKVPAREEQMTAYELLLSESQERMLVVAQKGREQEILDIYHKWDLNAVVIGEVVESDRVQYYKDGELKADIPADSLVLGGGAPQYVREAVRPAYLDELAKQSAPTLDANEDMGATLRKLLGSANIASKRWVFEQYDTMVRTNTVSGPGPSDAGVIRIKGTSKGLAAKTDCNGKYVYLNPRKGGQIAVAESARNVVCSGGKPLAVTNCLNFGNPYKPEVYWTFKEALGGMGDACRALSTPVTGGNVSFYNENPKGAIYPTPIIGMIGLVEDVDAHSTTIEFKASGEELFYLGAPRKGLDGSEYLMQVHGTRGKDAPEIDLEVEVRLQAAVLELIQSGLVSAAHDLSDGGLAVALAEMSLHSGIGASVGEKELEILAAGSVGVAVGASDSDAASDAEARAGAGGSGSAQEVLFSEAQSGVLVTLREGSREKAQNICAAHQIPLYYLGLTGGDTLEIGSHIKESVTGLKEIYESYPFGK